MEAQELIAQATSLQKAVFPGAMESMMLFDPQMEIQPELSE
jgi:hypothetical protein